MASSNLSFTTRPLELRSATQGASVITLRAPGAGPSQATLELGTLAVEYPPHTPINNIFTIHFNLVGTDPDQPVWGESFESRYVLDALPGGFLERHWNYESIDRATAYRPWHILMDLNDDRMLEWSLAKSWAVHALHDGEPEEEAAYEVTTGNTDAEGQACFRRTLEVPTSGGQVTAAVADESHRAVLTMDSSFTHGVFDLRPALYSGNTPQSFAYANLYARRVELAADAGLPVGLSFKGFGAGGDSVGLKLSAGSKVMELVAAGISGDPAGWTFNASWGQALAAGTVAVNTTDAAALGDGLGVLAMSEAVNTPDLNPTGGGVLYVEGGALMYRGSAGTVTMLAF